MLNNFEWGGGACVTILNREGGCLTILTREGGSLTNLTREGGVPNKFE